MKKIIWKLERFYWWLQHTFNPRHRYNIIRTGLRPGYYDPDTRIKFGVFSLVCEFVEKTKDTVDWGSDERHSEAWKVFSAARDFWLEYRQRLIDFGFESLDEEDRANEQARQHLAAIIGKLDFLWYP